mmetsp:Transcript_29422/g.71714  ORF Transcript_29422/g.71714 Transcript_29422/m.71714 type:complete len:268 (+) Transcript_29422:405-1208(+)
MPTAIETEFALIIFSRIFWCIFREAKICEVVVVVSIGNLERVCRVTPVLHHVVIANGKQLASVHPSHGLWMAAASLPIVCEVVRRVRFSLEIGRRGQYLCIPPRGRRAVLFLWPPGMTRLCCARPRGVQRISTVPRRPLPDHVSVLVSRGIRAGVVLLFLLHSQMRLPVPGACGPGARGGGPELGTERRLDDVLGRVVEHEHLGERLPGQPDLVGVPLLPARGDRPLLPVVHLVDEDPHLVAEFETEGKFVCTDDHVQALSALARGL